MTRTQVKATFKVGDVRQLRRPWTTLARTEVPAGGQFVIVSMETIPVRAKGCFTYRYTLWSTSWTNLKKAAPEDLVIQMIQGALNANTRPGTLPAKLPKEAPVSSGPHFGRAARPEEKIK